MGIMAQKKKDARFCKLNRIHNQKKKKIKKKLSIFVESVSKNIFSCFRIFFNILFLLNFCAFYIVDNCSFFSFFWFVCLCNNSHLLLSYNFSIIIYNNMLKK